VEVLEGDGDAGERPEVALADLLVGPVGILEGALPHDGRERADPLLDGVDAPEDVRDDIGGSDFPLSYPVLQLVDGQFV